MKRVMMWAMAAWLLAANASAQFCASHSSYYDGKRYDFNITHPQLDETPSWTEDAESPPLSPRKAIAVASACLPKLVPNAEKWRFAALHLDPVGNKEKWIYVVEFHAPHPPGVFDGPVRTMNIVVLMNGNPVQPVISKYKLLGD
jgi:hypothetical protein